LIFAIFLGFPVAFTLMAIGIAVGYYAYFDPSRMWREYFRLDETAGSVGSGPAVDGRLLQQPGFRSFWSTRPTP
jgi:hypothetical protein